MKLLLLLLGVAACLASDSSFAGLARVLEKGEEATVMPWLVPLNDEPSTTRRFCFVQSETFLSVARALQKRGHSVSFVAPEHVTLPEGLTRVPIALTKEKSNFGAAFEESFALFSSLRAASFDVIVFPASSGIGYLSMEAKRSGETVIGPPRARGGFFLFFFFLLFQRARHGGPRWRRLQMWQLF